METVSGTEVGPCQPLWKNCAGPGAACWHRPGGNDQQCLQSKHPAGWSERLGKEGLGQTVMFGIRPQQSRPSKPISTSGLEFWQGALGMRQPGLKIKMSPTAPLTHPSLSPESDRQGESSQFSELCTGYTLFLCSQGPWKLGKG